MRSLLSTEHVKSAAQVHDLSSVTSSYTCAVKRLAEACLICIVTNTITFVISMTLGRCISKTGSESDFETRGFFCEENQYNDMATLAFNPQEVAIKVGGCPSGGAHEVNRSRSVGVVSPEGCFHPCSAWSILCGIYAHGRLDVRCWDSQWSLRPLPPQWRSLRGMNSVLGPWLMVSQRLVAAGVQYWLPHHHIYPGTYALIGAACFLGGVVRCNLEQYISIAHQSLFRMTISLTVILIESTNEISYGLPLMITLMVAKLIGDIFNESIYDIHIELKHIPLLGWDSSEVCRYLWPPCA